MVLGTQICQHTWYKCMLTVTTRFLVCWSLCLTWL